MGDFAVPPLASAEITVRPKGGGDGLKYIIPEARVDLKASGDFLVTPISRYVVEDIPGDRTKVAEVIKKLHNEEASYPPPTSEEIADMILEALK